MLIFMLGICRWLLAASAAFAAVWLLWTVHYEIERTPDQIRTVQYEESRMLVYQFMRDDSKRFLDAAILVLAGLWSVAVVKQNDRITRRDIPEMIMFSAAMVFLGLFFCCVQEYGNVLERAFWDTTSGKVFPDVFNSPYLTMYDHAATKSFYGGLIASAVTIFSLCVVRKQRPSQEGTE